MLCVLGAEDKRPVARQLSRSYFVPRSLEGYERHLRQIQCEGYLQRQSRSAGTWRRRWFLLKVRFSPCLFSKPKVNNFFIFLNPFSLEKQKCNIITRKTEKIIAQLSVTSKIEEERIETLGQMLVGTEESYCWIEIVQNYVVFLLGLLQYRGIHRYRVFGTVTPRIYVIFFMLYISLVFFPFPDNTPKSCRRLETKKKEKKSKTEIGLGTTTGNKIIPFLFT